MFITLFLLVSGCVEDQTETSQQEVLQDETNIDLKNETSTNSENETVDVPVETHDPYEIKILKLDEYFTLPELSELGTNTKMSQFGVIAFADRLEQMNDKGYLLQGHTSSENISFWVKKTDMNGKQNWAKTLSKKNFTEITGIEEVNEEYAIFGKINGSAKIVFLNSNGIQVDSNEYNDFNMKNALKTTEGYLLLGSSKTTIQEGMWLKDYQHLVVVEIDNDLNELWRQKYTNITASKIPEGIYIENSTYLIVGDNNGILIETGTNEGKVADSTLLNTTLLNDTIRQRGMFIINDKYVSRSQDYETVTFNVVNISTNEKISHINKNYQFFDGPYCIKEADDGYTLIESVGDELYSLNVNESGAIDKDSIITEYASASDKSEYGFIQFQEKMTFWAGGDLLQLFGRYGIRLRYPNEAYIPTNTSNRITTVEVPVNLDITALPKEMKIRYIGQVYEEHKNGVPANSSLQNVSDAFKSSDGDFMYFEVNVWDGAELEDVEAFLVENGLVKTKVEERYHNWEYSTIEPVFPTTEDHFSGYYGHTWNHESILFAYPNISLTSSLLEFDEVWYVGLYEVKHYDLPVPEKPAVYLYPEKSQNISVKLNINGEIIKDIPEYDSGWDVYANADGEIYEQGQTYDYLFYECTLNYLELPSEGWCVSYDELPAWFDENLVKLGLNEKEKQQFDEYWLNRLPEEEYYTIKLLDNEFLDKNMGLDVSPKPDTVIRIEFVFKSSDYSVEMQEPEITTPQRDGFIVVEWGGIVCNDESFDSSATTNTSENFDLWD